MYKISNHYIDIDGDRLRRAVSRLPGFSCFSCSEIAEPSCRFVDGDKICPPIPADATILYRDAKDGYSSAFAKMQGGTYFFETSSEAGERLVFVTASDCKTATFYGDYADELLRFALWLAFGLAVLPSLTVSPHSSSILYEGKVILFLGESGTGKSTHSRLWLQNIEGSELFNDDSPIVRVIDGIPIAFGSPWSGKTYCYRNEHHLLAACVRLHQAPYNKIRRLTLPEAYAALHPSCPPEFAYDEALYDCVSDFLGAVISKVPVYDMEALPDADAARLVCDTIFK